MGTREAPRPCLRPAYRNTKEKKLCCSLARNNKGAEEHEEGDLSHPSGNGFIYIQDVLLHPSPWLQLVDVNLFGCYTTTCPSSTQTLML